MSDRNMMVREYVHVNAPLISAVRLLARVVVLVTAVSGQTDPTNVACSAINSTAVQVTWTQATDASVQGYHIDVIRVDGLRVEPQIPTIDLNDKTFDSYDVNGLGKYATYGVTIHSYTSGANLTDYVINCTTAEDVPGFSSTNFQCDGVTVTAIQCTWDEMPQVFWQGLPLGWRIQYVSANMSIIQEKTVGSNELTATITGLSYDSKYVLLLNAYTSVGNGDIYTTAIASTLGTVTTTEEPPTRYYCNEAVPGMIEFAWEEMPCTIYSGTIGGLIAVVTVFISIFACQACCSKSGGGNLALNITNAFESERGGRRKNPNDYDDDSDDTMSEKLSQNDDEEEEDERESDGDDGEGIAKTPSDIDGDDGRETRDTTTPRSPASPTSPTSPSGPTSPSAHGMRKREQSETSLGGALSPRQILINEEDAIDSDYDSQFEDEESMDDSYDESADMVGPLPAALAKHGIAKSKAKSSAEAQKTKQQSTVKDSITKDEKSQFEKNAKTKNKNSNKTEKNGSSQGKAHKSDRSTEAKPMTRSIKTSKSAQRTLVVTTAAIHNEHKTEEKTTDNFEDIWGDEINDKMGFGVSSKPNGEAADDGSTLKSRNNKGVENVSDDIWGDEWDNDSSCNNVSKDGQIAVQKNPNLKSSKATSVPKSWIPSVSQGNPKNKEGINGNVSAAENDDMWTDEKEDIWGSGTEDIWANKKVNVKNDVVPSTGNKNLALAKHQGHIPTGGDKSHTKGDGASFNEDFGDWGESENETGVNHGTTNKNAISKTDQVNFVIGEPDHTSSSSFKTKQMKPDVTTKPLAHSHSEPAFESGQSNNSTKGLPTSNSMLFVGQSASKGVTNVQKSNIFQEGKSNGSHVNGTQSINPAPPHIVNNNFENGKDMVKDIDIRSVSLGVASLQEQSPKQNLTATFHETDVEMVHLPHEKSNYPTNGSKVNTKPGKSPRAWGNQGQKESSMGKRTPVTQVHLQREWTAIEIEPVFEIDRLGKRFPFLNENINDKKEEHSYDLTKAQSKNLPKQAGVFFTAFDPATGDKNKNDRKTEDSGSKSQLFYGFGVGRFRKFAVAWLNKFRAKKSPVKSVASEWS